MTYFLLGFAVSIVILVSIEDSLRERKVGIDTNHVGGGYSYHKRN